VDCHDVWFRDQQVEGPWGLQGIGDYAHLLDHARSKRDVCALLQKAGCRRQRWLNSRETVSLHDSLFSMSPDQRESYGVNWIRIEEWHRSGMGGKQRHGTESAWL
jgi:hypothetical protein